MPDNDDNIKQLYAKLESLLNRQEQFYREINDLKLEISRLKNPAAEQGITPAEQQKTDTNPLNPSAAHRNHKYRNPLPKYFLHLRKALLTNLLLASNSNQVLKILSGKT